ncbi:lysylphosphatidylglycerol synthase domain-containing protein [Streptomyces cylindrosporus]|uniref:Lysylphosphatidylglycerol synthase domain-containing protein n=1 Tax=Streptomyces cylindrosporus TaxID=2927583 RepID=A0ABS9Y9Y0_9ACTN|nr:lysylphosphatidylglycerol synthase domain-containing protein [Streptomyces cylindrosporus]MCI3274029.1 lysylphosphatidylglycerol synthase domain-containing protein [Streptomyces cylindrosporus]
MADVVPAARQPGPRRRACWQAALTLAGLVGAVWLVRRHWPVLHTGAVRLALADHGWLLLAATAAAGTWFCAALAQQGAVTRRLPPGRLLAAQFAATAANHMLPAGLGAGAVNLRFLMRCGLTPARSATALAVKATAGVVVRATLIAVLTAACPGLLRLPRLSGAAVAAGVAVVLLLPGVVLWPRCRRALAAVLADIRAVHVRRGRAPALWGGSLAFVALHSLVLIAVTRAVALPLAPERVTLLYLAASSAAALLPTPGGLGSLDAALALALTVAGAPGAAAASVVLGYRLLTVWLPLLPGLLVLGVLVRRKAL